MVRVLEQDIAWCAGVIDVLGLVKTRTMETGSELAFVQVSSPLIEVTQQLAKFTGVQVVMVHRQYNRLGCDQHCTDAHVHVYSETGRWTLVGARAIVFLEAILPYVRIKTPDIKATLAKGQTSPMKEATFKKMKALGWPVGDEK
jgi:hypothetical protein